MMLKQIWKDERAFVASTDLIFIAAIVALGTIVGLTTFRDQVVQEFGDLATAIGRLNQSYEYTECEYVSEISDAYAWVSESSYTDEPDFCEVEDVDGDPPAGITLSSAALAEGNSLSPTPPP